MSKIPNNFNLCFRKTCIDGDVCAYSLFLIMIKDVFQEEYIYFVSTSYCIFEVNFYLIG